MSTSIKLTTKMKEHIIKTLTKRKFDKLFQEHKSNEVKIAEKLYNAIFSKTEQRKMKSLPEGWLVKRSHIQIFIGGFTSFSFKFSEDYKIEKLFPDSFNKGSINITKNIEASKIALDYVNNGEALQEEKRRAELAAWSVLNSVTTVNKAIEVWPEAAVFIKEAVGLYGNPPIKANLPVVVVTEVNKMLNLPPKGTK